MRWILIGLMAFSTSLLFSQDTDRTSKVRDALKSAEVTKATLKIDSERRVKVALSLSESAKPKVEAPKPKTDNPKIDLGKLESASLLSINPKCQCCKTKLDTCKCDSCECKDCKEKVGKRVKSEYEKVYDRVLKGETVEWIVTEKIVTDGDPILPGTYEFFPSKNGPAMKAKVIPAVNFAPFGVYCPNGKCPWVK